METIYGVGLAVGFSWIIMGIWLHVWITLACGIAIIIIVLTSIWERRKST